MLQPMVGEIHSELQRYADLIVALAHPDADRDSLLSEAGLDEDSWEQLDASWQERLSQDERGADARGEVPPLWIAFSKALQNAQERSRANLLDLESYAAIARVLARGGDISVALKRKGIPLLEFLRAHRHWIGLASSDAEVSDRLEALLS